MYTHLTREPFRGSDAVAAGHVTPGRLRGPEFTALFRGTYVGSSVKAVPLLRARALTLRAGPGAVVAGPLAARVHGVDCPWEDAEAIVPSNRRLGSDGVTTRLDSLAPWEVVETKGVTVTSPARTAFDLARRDAPLPDRVAAVDALAHAHRFGAPALLDVAEEHPGVRGSVDVREVLALMDPRSESLMETRLRLVVVFSDLPAPDLQVPVTLPSGKGARLDLAWRRQKVALEYDGEEHRTPAQHADDLDRDAGLADLGWRVLRVTARQVYRFPDDLVRRLARMLAL